MIKRFVCRTKMKNEPSTLPNCNASQLKGLSHCTLRPLQFNNHCLRTALTSFFIITCSFSSSSTAAVCGHYSNRRYVTAFLFSFRGHLQIKQTGMRKKNQRIKRTKLKVEIWMKVRIVSCSCTFSLTKISQLHHIT